MRERLSSCVARGDPEDDRLAEGHLSREWIKYRVNLTKFFRDSLARLIIGDERRCRETRKS